MRALVLALALLGLAIVPTADASHIGPCGHEYAEIVLWVALGEASPKEGLQMAGRCVSSTPDGVCDVIRLCVMP